MPASVCFCFVIESINESLLQPLQCPLKTNMVGQCFLCCMLTKDSVCMPLSLHGYSSSFPLPFLVYTMSRQGSATSYYGPHSLLRQWFIHLYNWVKWWISFTWSEQLCSQYIFNKLHFIPTSRSGQLELAWNRYYRMSSLFVGKLKTQCLLCWVCLLKADPFLCLGG